MPFYCFTNDAGTKTVLERFPASKRPKTIRRNGETLHFDFAQTARRSGNCFAPWRSGCRLWAIGVHPSQVAEARDHARRHGVDATYDSDGVPTVKSRSDYYKLLKSRGFYDLDRFT